MACAPKQILPLALEVPHTRNSCQKPGFSDYSDEYSSSSSRTLSNSSFLDTAIFPIVMDLAGGRNERRENEQNGIRLKVPLLSRKRPSLVDMWNYARSQLHTYIYNVMMCL